MNLHAYLECVLQALTRPGLMLLSFEKLAELGEESPVPAAACKPSDICTILYTSGTGVAVSNAGTTCVHTQQYHG